MGRGAGTAALSVRGGLLGTGGSRRLHCQGLRRLASALDNRRGPRRPPLIKPSPHEHGQVTVDLKRTMVGILKRISRQSTFLSSSLWWSKSSPSLHRALVSGHDPIEKNPRRHTANFKYGANFSFSSDNCSVSHIISFPHPSASLTFSSPKGVI